MRICIVMALALLCAGCSNPVYYTSAFDRAEAERMLRPGKNTIIVHSFTRSPNSGIIYTCKGDLVNLMPLTERAVEYISFAFGSPDGGQAENIVFNNNLGDIQDSDHNLTMLTIDGLCDSEGLATFKNIGDGEYYLISRTDSPVKGESGYRYAKKIRVEGGETKKVLLSGESPKIDDDNRRR